MLSVELALFHFSHKQNLNHKLDSEQEYVLFFLAESTVIKGEKEGSNTACK